jgi:hypothetical protein
MLKKTKGDLFEKSIKEWTEEDYFMFMSLSETVRKRLPNFSTAGEATKFVLDNYREFQNTNKCNMEKSMTAQYAQYDQRDVLDVLTLMLDRLKKYEPELVDIPPFMIKDPMSLGEHLRLIKETILAIMMRQKQYQPLNPSQTSNPVTIVDDINKSENK